MGLTRYFAWVIVLLVGLASEVWSAPYASQLDNGLKLIVLPDHRAPVVMVQVWYRVGSSYESNGVTGISHALEHMMFRGTAQIPNGAFSQTIAALGGTDNAFTSYDYTAYHELVPSRALDQVLAMEADRMHQLKFDPNLFEKEMKAVLEERRMRIDDRPMALAQERFNAAAYVSSPYHHPVIGWVGDILEYRVQDALAWYQQWYAPNNATVVIVGDVVPEKAMASVKKYFADIPKRRLPTLKKRSSQKPMLQQKLVASLPLPNARVQMAFHVPTLGSVPTSQRWQIFALSVLANALDSGSGGLLVEALQDQKHWVSSLEVRYRAYRLHAGLFELQATLLPGVSLKQVTAAMQAQISMLVKQPISPARLARIKAQVIASHVYAQDAIDSKAMHLGVLSALNLPLSLYDDYVKEIQQITPAQIQAVAQQFFDEKHRLVLWIKPLGTRRLSKHGGAS